MLIVKTLEETRTADLIEQALEMGVLQLRDHGVYYGGCTRVADSLELLEEILDEDPDFLEQLHLACQPLGGELEEDFLPEALWVNDRAEGVSLGAFFPELSAVAESDDELEKPVEAPAADEPPDHEKPVEASTPDEPDGGEKPVEAPTLDEPEAAEKPVDDPAVDAGLVSFLASPEGAEARAGLQTDAEVLRLAAQEETLSGEDIPTIGEFRKKHRDPLQKQISALTSQCAALQAKTSRVQLVRSRMQENLRQAQGNHHLEAALRKQLNLLVDPAPELARLEQRLHTLRGKAAAYQAEEDALAARWAEIDARVEAEIAAHPTLQLFAAVAQALAERRQADLTRLMRLIGEQSNQTLLALANQSDLGADEMQVIRTALSSRAWIQSITPAARTLAAEVAASRAYQGQQLPAKAHTLILRAEHILVLDRENKECARIHVGPDGIGRWSKGQPGRPWSVKKEDTWKLE